MSCDTFNVCWEYAIDIFELLQKRIKDMFNYKSSDVFQTTNAQSRLNEEKKLGSFIDEVRKIDTKKK